MAHPRRISCEACGGLMAEQQGRILKALPHAVQIDPSGGYAIIECTAPCGQPKTWYFQSPTQGKPSRA